jgi:hypothetical protein
MSAEISVPSPPPHPALVRATEAIAGRCLSETGEEMSCTFEDASVVEMRVVGPDALKQGSVLVCYLNEVGIVPARIMGESPYGGWLVRPILAADRKERVASRIAWHVERAEERAEQRSAPRIVPENRRVVVQLGERLSFRGIIQNLSITGAAIALNQACVPYVGSPVRVGRREAVVVRVTADGIAVEFKTPLPAATFDERIIL